MEAQPEQSQSQPALSTVGRTRRVDTSKLTVSETVWRDHSEWLKTQGYMLRPRYRVGWVPEWKGKDMSVYDYEDAIPMKVSLDIISPATLRC